MLRIVFVWCSQEYGNIVSGFKKGKGISIVPEHLLCTLEGLCYIRLKGKAVPLQAWTGPEGSRRLRLPDFKTAGT